MPHLVQMHDKFPKNKVVIIALSNEPKPTVEPYVAKAGMPYAVGYGSSSDRDYGVRGIPHSVVVGPDGTIKFDGYPSGKEFDSIVESLAATVKSNGSGGGGSVNSGDEALGAAVVAALKTEGPPKDFIVSYQRTDPAKKTVREIKVGPGVDYSVRTEGSNDVKKGRVDEKELRDILKAIDDTGFAVKDFKEPAKPNVVISAAIGKNSREIKFDQGKGFGNFGRVNKLLEDLYGKYSKR